MRHITRWTGLVTAVIALAPAWSANAAPRQAGVELNISPDDALPVPPIPPAPTTEFRLAPVPDSDVSAPRAPTASQGASISPGFYQGKDYNIGEGYMPGSTVQGDQEHKAKPMPSLNLKVPLQ
jgi:hypothetical protein